MLVFVKKLYTWSKKAKLEHSKAGERGREREREREREMTIFLLQKAILFCFSRFFFKWWVTHSRSPKRRERAFFDNGPFFTAKTSKRCLCYWSSSFFLILHPSLSFFSIKPRQQSPRPWRAKQRPPSSAAAASWASPGASGPCRPPSPRQSPASAATRAAG